jgi:titin
LTTIGNTTSYTHTGLTTGSQYSYRAYAINSAGTSVVSNIATAKPGHTLVPTNLIADDISPTSILLTWTAPSQTFGGSISGYIISKRFSADVYDPVGETNGPQTSYTVTGLKTGQAYTFVVKARYNIGTNSDNSSPASATPTTSSSPPSKFTVPNSPTGLVATATSPIQIDLVWNAPTNDGGSPITGYKIDVKTGTGGYVTLKDNTGSTSRTYSHPDRITGTTYAYKVYAINSVGTSTSSNEASATPNVSSTPTVTKTKPSQPTSLVATAVSPTQINLSWKVPSNNGGEPITGYKIEASEGGGTYQVLSQNATTSTTYSHTGLKPGTSYFYRVYAINSIGTGSFEDTSTTTKAQEKEPEPEPKPTTKIPDFVDPKKGAQYYLDRYNNEPAYKKWFDTNYPDYTIQEAIELAIPGSFPEDSAKPILPFVDPKKDPQYYIDRYNNEPAYKKWFDENFPDYTIFEAVGVEEPEEIEEPEAQIGVCGPGTVLVNGYCEAEKSQSGGGCLIATATFGSELSPQVQSLRELRDNTLLHTNSGSSFMTGFNQFYYLFSPTVADLERENPLFKEAVKISITPMISSLSILNYANIDSEQEVLVYGLGIILLNIGMYFALPVFTILTVKRNLFHKSSRN